MAAAAASMVQLRAAKTTFLRAVLARHLGIGILADGDRPEDVPLGQDADPGVRIDDDGGADLAGVHHPGRLT